MIYVEDILTELYTNHITHVDILSRDFLILDSFYNIHTRGDSLTKSQGSLLVRLLKKYSLQFTKIGFDYASLLENPEWKSRFRALDLTKKLYVEKDSGGILWLMVKFPYQLKELFDKANTDRGFWDSERKCRKFQFYSANLMQIYEFAVDNQFQIDESFISAMAEYEEILSQQDNIIPTCEIVDGKVKLVNAGEEATQWWEENFKNSIPNDLLLAKSMGFRYSSPPSSKIEKIAATSETHFWDKSHKEILELCKVIDGKTCLILDRTHERFDWIKSFTKTAEEAGFSKDEIKICFRLGKEHEEFNNWIKENGYGGKVDTGRLLIFTHKAAKWVFKSIKDVKIIATNNVYPPTDLLTRDWMNSHPCVIYLGEVIPSKLKERTIVNL